MKKIGYLILAFLLIGANACKKSSLDLKNPNEPSMESLKTEEGITRAGLGVYSKFGLDYWWLALTTHDIMGDSYFTSVGNFGWRWVNQVSSITLSNGTVLTPPQGGAQINELRARNSRVFGDQNMLQYEWSAMYLVNNQANLILSAVEAPEMAFSGNAEVKKNTLRAWAYWWKGFAYSRIGSLYISGVISNELNKTNSNFLSHEVIIAEANKNFDLAIAALNGITGDESYTTLLSAMIPSFTKLGKGGVLSPQEWIRNINTYKARNLLVNKEVAALTASDWASISTLTENGIKAGDKIFTMRSADANDLVSITAWQPYRSTIGWTFVSERLMQDFKPGDDRKARNFYIPANGFNVINNQGRGFNYGTRYDFNWIEDGVGADYASQVNGLAEIPVACSFEENQLMLAEAKIRNGSIEDGLALIDAVRTYQKAALPAVVGTSLNLSQALEELRRERRIGLFNKNVSFYDARRWGILKPVAQGGGRKNATIIYTPTGGGAFVVDNNATIDYNYMSWWDVPGNELDFNKPGTGSAPVVGN